MLKLAAKDHLKYARAVVRSWESRVHFDAGALSEPIMLLNLFRAYLKGTEGLDRPQERLVEAENGVYPRGNPLETY